MSEEKESAMVKMEVWSTKPVIGVERILIDGFNHVMDENIADLLALLTAAGGEWKMKGRLELVKNEEVK